MTNVAAPRYGQKARKHVNEPKLNPLSRIVLNVLSNQLLKAQQGSTVLNIALM